MHDRMFSWLLLGTLQTSSNFEAMSPRNCRRLTHIWLHRAWHPETGIYNSSSFLSLLPPTVLLPYQSSISLIDLLTLLTWQNHRQMRWLKHWLIVFLTHKSLTKIYISGKPRSINSHYPGVSSFNHSFSPEHSRLVNILATFNHNNPVLIWAFTKYYPD